MIGTANTGVYTREPRRLSISDIHQAYMRCGVCDKIKDRLTQKPLAEEIQTNLKAQDMKVQGMCKDCLHEALYPERETAKPGLESVTIIESIRKVA